MQDEPAVDRTGVPNATLDVSVDEAGPAAMAVQSAPQPIDWTELIRLAATAVPLTVVMLPAAGYVVRLIGFLATPWVPADVALNAPIGELGAVGFYALIGGWTGASFFVFMAIGRRGKVVYAPFASIAAAWRDYGPTRARLIRLRARVAAIRKALVRMSRAPRSRAHVRDEGRALAARARAYLARPRAKRRLAIMPILWIVYALLALTGIWLGIYWVWAIAAAIVGVSIGSAVQAVVGYFGLWMLGRISSRHGRITLQAVVPVVIVVLVGMAIGSGLNATFTQRPAQFFFAADANMADARYQEIGSNNAFVYLVRCDPQPGQVYVVAVSGIEKFLPDASFKPPPRTKIQDAVTRGDRLSVGYMPCQ